MISERTEKPITLRDMADCAKRELAYRRRVYARLVADGKMTVHHAKRQIEIMRRIFEDYDRMATAEEKKWELPGLGLDDDAREPPRRRRHS